MRKSALVLFLLLFCLAFFVPVGALEATGVEGSAGYVKIPDMIADQGIPAGQYSLVQCYVHDAKGNAIPGVAVYFTIDTSANPNQNKIFQSSVTDSTGRAYAHLSSPIAGSASVSAYYQLPGDNKYTVKNIAVTFFPAPKPSVTDDLLNTIQTFMARMTHSSGQGARIPPINGAAPGIPRTAGSGIPNPQASGAAPGIPRALGSGTLNPQTAGAGSAIPSSYYDNFAGLFTGTYAVNVNTNSTNAYRPEAPAQNSQFSPNVGVIDQGSDIVIDGYYKSVPIHLVSKVTRTLNTATCSLSFNLANKTISGAGTLTFTMGQDGTPVVNGRGEGAYSRPYTPEKGADYHPGSGTVTGTRLSTALPNNTDNDQGGVGPVGDIPGPDNTDQAATGIIAPGLLTLAAAAAGSLPNLPDSSGGPDASLPDGGGGDGSGDGGGDGSGDGGGDGSGDGGGDGGGGDTSSSYLDPTTEVPPVDTSTQPPAPPVDTSTQPTMPPVSETPPAAGTTAAADAAAAAAAAAAVPPAAQPPAPPGPPDGTEKVWHDPVTGNDLVMLYNANLVTQSGDGTLQKGDWVWKDQPDKIVQDSMVANSDSVAAEKTQAIAEQAAVNVTGADLKQTLDPINKKYQDQLNKEKALDSFGDKIMTSSDLTDNEKQDMWNKLQQQISNVEDGKGTDPNTLKAIAKVYGDRASGLTAADGTQPSLDDFYHQANIDAAWNTYKEFTTGTKADGSTSYLGMLGRGLTAIATGGASEVVITPLDALNQMKDNVDKGMDGLSAVGWAAAGAAFNHMTTQSIVDVGNLGINAAVNKFPSLGQDVTTATDKLATKLFSGAAKQTESVVSTQAASALDNTVGQVIQSGDKAAVRDLLSDGGSKNLLKAQESGLVSKESIDHVMLTARNDVNGAVSNGVKDAASQLEKATGVKVKNVMIVDSGSSAVKSSGLSAASDFDRTLVATFDDKALTSYAQKMGVSKGEAQSMLEKQYACLHESAVDNQLKQLGYKNGVGDVKYQNYSGFGQGAGKDAYGQAFTAQRTEFQSQTASFNFGKTGEVTSHVSTGQAAMDQYTLNQANASGQFKEISTWTSRADNVSTVQHQAEALAHGTDVTQAAKSIVRGNQALGKLGASQIDPELTKVADIIRNNPAQTASTLSEHGMTAQQFIDRTQTALHGASNKFNVFG